MLGRSLEGTQENGGLGNWVENVVKWKVPEGEDAEEGSSSLAQAGPVAVTCGLPW